MADRNEARPRLPWEIVETFPSTSIDLIAGWRHRLDEANDDVTAARAAIGVALTHYWAVAEGCVDDPAEVVARRRADLLADAARLAGDDPDPDLTAELVLGELYATWGPDSLLDRTDALARLAALREHVTDPELAFRIDEWQVVDAFDHGDLSRAGAGVEAFARRSASTDLTLFRRREELWRANLAMLRGEIDRSVQINQDIIATTADLSGTPFSFQNVAITVAIERFLRRGLGDVVDSIRSIRASSPRVAMNWTVGLAFSLAESGQLEEAAEVFAPIVDAELTTIPRDLNWLVTVQLVGLIALRLDDGSACDRALLALAPFAHLDGTHGSGYASYGPVGRVVGALRARRGDTEEAVATLDRVLATRDPGPWTALAALDRARALVRLDAPAAASAARGAHRDPSAFDMTGWAMEADRLVTELELAGHGRPVAVLRDGTWLLRHPAGGATVPDGVAVRHLLHLLAHPGAPVGVTDLDGGHVTDSDLTETTLDHDARAAYRARLADLAGRDDEDAEAEADFLRRELAGSAYHVPVSAEVERARVRVTKALARAIARVAEEDATLGEHLRRSVSTGRTCLYDPDDGQAWFVDDTDANADGTS